MAAAHSTRTECHVASYRPRGYCKPELLFDLDRLRAFLSHISSFFKCSGWKARLRFCVPHRLPCPPGRSGPCDAHIRTQAHHGVPSSLALGHGQARSVLAALRLGWTADEPRFDTWLKALRRAGVPFDEAELGVGTGRLLSYRFVHLMELALALLLKSTGLLDGHTVDLLRAHRPRLRKLYAEAWQERASGRGEPLLLQAPGFELRLQGLYLDLAPEVLESGVLSLPEPRLLTPLEAVTEVQLPGTMAGTRVPPSLCPISPPTSSAWPRIRRRSAAAAPRPADHARAHDTHTRIEGNPMPMKPPRHLPPPVSTLHPLDEIARRLGVCIRTVQRLIEAGLLDDAPHRPGGARQRGGFAALSAGRSRLTSSVI